MDMLSTNSNHCTTYIRGDLRIVQLHYLQQPLNLIHERPHLTIPRCMIG